MEAHSAIALPETLKLIELGHQAERDLEELIVQDQINISQIPEIMVTTRQAIIAVIKNPVSYLDLPFRVKSNELGLLACQLDHKLSKLLPLQSMSWINSQFNTPILSFFPEQYRLSQLCDVALKSNQENIRYVPSILFSNRSYIEDVVFLYPNSLLYIDKTLIDDELCDIALESESFELRYVPSQFRSESLSRTAFKKKASAFFDLPKEFISDEDYFSVVKRCEKEELSRLIDMLDQNNQSYDLWLEICKKDSSHIRNLPPQFISEHFIYEVAPYIIKASHIRKYIPEHIRGNDEIKYRLVESNPMLLEAVPEKDRDHFLCQKAVQTNGLALQFVPFIRADVDMNMLALQQNGLSLKYIPQPFRDMAYPKVAVQQNGEAIEYVPLQYQTEEICRIAVQGNARAIYHIHPVKMSSELALIAIKKDPSDLSMIPENYRNHEICKIAYKHSAKNYLFIPNHIKTVADILAITEYYKGTGTHIEGLNETVVK